MILSLIHRQLQKQLQKEYQKQVEIREKIQNDLAEHAKKGEESKQAFFDLSSFAFPASSPQSPNLSFLSSSSNSIRTVYELQSEESNLSINL